MGILPHVNGQLLQRLRIVQHLRGDRNQTAGHFPQHSPCMEHRFGNGAGLVFIFGEILIL
ncbi:hypothetical protein D3C76_1877020 [compost metagenome]